MGGTYDVDIARDLLLEDLGIAEALDSDTDEVSFLILVEEHALHAFQLAFKAVPLPEYSELVSLVGRDGQVREDTEISGIVFRKGHIKGAALGLEGQVAVIIHMGDVTFGLKYLLQFFCRHGYLGGWQLPCGAGEQTLRERLPVVPAAVRHGLVAGRKGTSPELRLLRGSWPRTVALVVISDQRTIIAEQGCFVKRGGSTLLAQAWIPLPSKITASPSCRGCPSYRRAGVRLPRDRGEGRRSCRSGPVRPWRR